METRERISNRRGRLGTMILAALLVCALLLPAGTAALAVTEGGAVTSVEAAPKPLITIQGNVVVDKNKPTGFYELALCVRTARTVTDINGVQTPAQAEEAYAALLKEAEKTGDRKPVEEFLKTHTVKNYPFQSAAAAVHINLDVLTAVTWGAGKPVYETWTGTGYQNNNVDYPRGIDLTKKDDQPDIFTDLKPIINKQARFVRLDAAHPDEMTNATALVEEVNGNDALLTLTAATTTTANVVYETSTPVVVVRFAYDMDRFPNLDVGDADAQPAEPNNSDFWLGLDQHDRAGADVARTPLTYLADSALDPTGVTKLTASDEAAAASTALQTVWYEQNMEDNQVGQRGTQFYYYLKGENMLTQGDGAFQVYDPVAATVTPKTLKLPDTEGRTVLANRSTDWATAGDPETDTQYSFFQNLLQNKNNKGTLRLTLVNAETYRKPTGGGGTTILFYDWDDSLIGSLVVDKGDVRAEVNEYVENNLVHPDLRASKLLNNGKVPEDDDPNRTEYTNLLESLERDYTYRGKYAYTVGDPDDVGENGDTAKKARADGAEYPLTNKLDYAFYRRVNRIVEQTDADGTTSYYSTTSPLAADNLDAALYPYVYGWAVVENDSDLNREKWQVRRDALKLEDVWTTMGVGELSAVKPEIGGTTETIPAAANQTVREPAFIAYETAKKVAAGNPVPAPTQYQYTTATTAANRYFRFADFSDIDAELSRYQKETGGNKDTLIVKAVYEPGKSLTLGNNYTVVNNPAYTKWNSIAADKGAAYRVIMTLDRSCVVDNVVYGTTRVRSPMIQQDTTIDSKWVTDTELGVDHNIKNPSFQVSKDQTETLFSQVEIDNGEEIQFSLTLSARQNKVDYILIETYNANYIAGTQRSYKNSYLFNTAIEKFVVDNYNYLLVGDSNEKDDYYDCDFATKEGSHGFVLYCTLGHMLEQATKCNHGEVDRSKFNTAVGYTIVRDTNLRMDASGKEPAVVHNATLQEKFLLAATACENHKNDPDYDCWDVNLDCAKLSYHQMQWFILDGGTDIRTVKDADDAKLDWCHLHASCAAAMSTVPDTWDEIIAAARANNEADLKKMTPTAIETLTSLRRNANGRQFDTAADFTAAIIDAVAKLDAAHIDPTWGNLQYVIINGAAADTDAMKEAGQAAYWWYDGSTSAPSLPSAAGDGQWSFLLQAAKDSYTAVPTLKDGVTADWTSSVRLNLARTPFDRNNTPNQVVQKSWIDLTHNLVKNATEEEREIKLEDGGTETEIVYTHEKFATFEEFRAALVAAVRASEVPKDFPPTWEQVQWFIIKSSWASNPDGTQISPTEPWWWKDGKVPLRVSSLTTLLQALDQKENGTDEEKATAEAALAKVTSAFFDNTVYLRFDQDGKNGQLLLADLSLSVSDAIAKVDAARKAGATTWNQVQYYLMNGALADDDAINKQSAFYWWKNGGEGTAVDFSTASDIQAKLTILMSATSRTQFGDPKAMQSVTDAVGSDVFEFMRVIKPLPEGTALEDIDTMADVLGLAHDDATNLLQAVELFKQKAQEVQGLDEYATPRVNWYQLQYFILNNMAYIAADSNDPVYAALKDPETGYWWYDPNLTERPKPPPPPSKNKEPSDGLAEIILQYLNGGFASETEMASTVDTPAFKNTYMLYKDKTGATYATSGRTLATARTQMRTKLKNLALALKTSPYYDAENKTLTLYWAQIQYFYDTGTLTDHVTALREIVNTWGWTQGGATKNFIPADVDLSVL